MCALRRRTLGSHCFSCACLIHTGTVVQGILLGGLTMEMTGTVSIVNECNGLSATLDFKQKVWQPKRS